MNRYRTAARRVFLGLLMSAGATAMASSLILPSPAQLAGHWELHQQDQVCPLDLIENASALGGDVECASRWLGENPASWSPTPDGIWLMNAEGTGITHLNRNKDGEYEGRTKSGSIVVLRRAP
ncbi:protease inhibitor Inh/omp19 family protein [Pseudomonas fluorescens]|uniref:protease inhibitor Inh/omp19 family protein n=1 Tax=Pseudomonas fluorescens TaxID=294 RepID=UPI001BE5C81A|nr:protease inhibitor Inh/omp19 family protein [Pseudomonas fluorescens]MBT2372885.1 protease inhibitor Inh/omp19 family protein [Pseudomonas fluorescens]